jgi:hypothetical protein
MKNRKSYEIIITKEIHITLDADNLNEALSEANQMAADGDYDVSNDCDTQIIAAYIVDCTGERTEDLTSQIQN